MFIVVSFVFFQPFSLVPALFKAIEHGRTEVVSLLIAHKADMNVWITENIVVC